MLDTAYSGASDNAQIHPEVPWEPEQPFLWEKLPVIPKELSSMAECLRRVSEKYGIPISDLKSHSRHAWGCDARHEFFWLVRNIKRADGTPKFSFPQASHFLGERDHTCALRSYRVFEKRRQVWALAFGVEL